MTTLAEHRAQFTAEFVTITDQLAHTCAELGKLMATYRLNPAGLIDAQGHALASLSALRKVAEALPAAGKPSSPTRPAQWTGTLADQLASHRAAVAQTLALVQHMPGIGAHDVADRSATIATHLHHLEIAARTHQPSKARA